MDTTVKRIVVVFCTKPTHENVPPVSHWLDASAVTVCTLLKLICTRDARLQESLRPKKLTDVTEIALGNCNSIHSPTPWVPETHSVALLPSMALVATALASG